MLRRATIMGKIKGPKAAHHDSRARIKALIRDPTHANAVVEAGSSQTQHDRQAWPTTAPSQHHQRSASERIGSRDDINYEMNWQGQKPPSSWHGQHLLHGNAPQQHLGHPPAMPYGYQGQQYAPGPSTFGQMHHHGWGWGPSACSRLTIQQSHVPWQAPTLPPQAQYSQYDYQQEQQCWSRDSTGNGHSGSSAPFEPTAPRLQERRPWNETRARSPTAQQPRLRRGKNSHTTQSNKDETREPSAGLDEKNDTAHVLNSRQKRNKQRAQARQELKQAQKRDDRVFRDQRERGYESPPPPWIQGEARERELQRQLQKRAEFARDDRNSRSPSQGSGERTREASPSQPVPFERRKKWARASGAPPPPTEDYLAVADQPSKILPADADVPPPQLILDLNNTLLCRMKTGSNSSNRPWVRPYASTFLQYACGAGLDNRRLWDTVVFSSAASYNVLALLEALCAVPFERAREHQSKRRGLPWEAQYGEPLSLIWSRENLGLTAQEFTLNVETCKDLSQVWRARPGWGPERSVLLDDEPAKAAQQPFNHVPIHPFIIDPDSVKGIDSSPEMQQLLMSPFPIAKELPQGHSYYDDTSLLSAIYVLEQVRTQSNIAGFIKQTRLELDVSDEEERVLEGRRICEELGIEVERSWNREWWAKTRKERRRSK
ncbi:hypothetical protein ACM66B_005557 [Microbotryomycetes sp. NB124-2]